MDKIIVKGGNTRLKGTVEIEGAKMLFCLCLQRHFCQAREKLFFVMFLS